MKKYLSLILALTLLLTLLAGCGSSGSTASYDSGMVEYAMSDEVAMAPAEGAALKNDTADTGSAALPESRKWIVTVDLTAETDQNIYNGSTYQSGRRYRSASLTIRIPAGQVDAFLQDMGGIANIVRQNKSIEDVTLNYVATESRLNALQTEEARLLELLSQAETMSDLLEIEQRLAEVRYELENYASQKRLYDNQIDYATVYLSIEEVQEYTPVEEPTLWERISKGFKDNLEGVGDDLLDVLVWLIVSIPYLVVLAVVVVIVVLIVKRIRRRRAAKKAAKQQKPEES